MTATALNPTQTETIQVLVRTVLPDTRALYVSGSAASGQRNEVSDIDLGILASGPVDPQVRTALREELEDALQTDVDVIDLHRASTVPRAQVVAGGVLLYDGDPRLRERLEGHAQSAQPVGRPAGSAGSPNQGHPIKV